MTNIEDYFKNADETINKRDSIIAFAPDRVYKKLYYNCDTYDTILKSYNLAVYFGLIIHEINEKYIVTSTPRYKYSLLEQLNKIKYEVSSDDFKNILMEYLHKIKVLIRALHEKNIIHWDLAFRNICIDEYDNLHLIDFETLVDGDIYGAHKEDEEDKFLPFVDLENDIFNYFERKNDLTTDFFIL